MTPQKSVNFSLGDIMPQVKLQGLRFLHVGLVYRNRQDIQDQLSTSNLCDLFQEAVEMQATRLVIVGDFNLREMDWNHGISLESASHFSQQFLACTQENYLDQHVTAPTRFRPGNTPSLLDLIFSNEEGIVNDARAPLGHSNHSCLSFEVEVEDMNVPSASKVSYRNINRGDYIKLKEVMDGIDWSQLACDDVEEHWKNISAKIHQATEDCLPLVSRKKMKNLFMNREGIQLRRKKNKAYAEYTRSKSEDAWKKYSKIRNKLRKWTRVNRRKFEANLIKNVKCKPKMLWEYINLRPAGGGGV